MEEKIKLFVVIAGIIITISTMVYKFGKQGKALDVMQIQIMSIKTDDKDMRDRINQIDKRSATTTDNLSSLHVLVNSNFEDVYRTLDQHSAWLTRTSNRQDKDKDILLRELRRTNEH